MHAPKSPALRNSLTRHVPSIPTQHHLLAWLFCWLPYTPPRPPCPDPYVSSCSGCCVRCGVRCEAAARIFFYTLVAVPSSLEWVVACLAFRAEGFGPCLQAPFLPPCTYSVEVALILAMVSEASDDSLPVAWRARATGRTGGGVRPPLAHSHALPSSFH